jgi:hypothetical protein
MMNKKAIIGIVLLTLAAALVWYAYREYYRPHERISDLTPSYTMEATALIREFETQEGTANQNYLSKVLLINGMIKSVDSSGGDFIVSLGDTTQQTSVRCFLDASSHPQKAIFQRGMTISIKGYCTGFNADELLGSDVLLDRCTLDPETNKQPE